MDDQITESEIVQKSEVEDQLDPVIDDFVVVNSPDKQETTDRDSEQQNEEKQEEIDLTQADIDLTQADIDPMQAQNREEELQSRAQESQADQNEVTEPESRQLPLRRFNLGAMSQMDISGRRPPACTLFAALAAEFIVANLDQVIAKFLEGDVDYFKKMHTDIYNEGVPIYMHAEANNLTSVLDGRLNPDEIASQLPQRFQRFQIQEQKWLSGNAAFGQEIQLFEAIGGIFTNVGDATRVVFIVADAETFVLVNSGLPDRCFYFNSHKTGLASETGGRATEFAVMDTSEIYQFLTMGMHGNQPCNSIDFFYCNL